MPRLRHPLLQPLFSVPNLGASVRIAEMELKLVMEAALPRPPVSLGFVKQQHAVLLSQICVDRHLVLLWIEKQLLEAWRRWGGLSELPSHDMLNTWREMHQYSELIQMASGDPVHPVRQMLMRFLVESLIAEEIIHFLARGIYMPPGDVPLRYVRKWSYLPQSLLTIRHVDRIAQHPQVAKKWCRGFRARWNLRWGSTGESRKVPEEDRARRTAILIRWIRWARSRAPQGSHVVLINMDETCLTNIKTHKRGLLPAANHSAAKRVRNATAYGGPRTSLCAAICDDPDLQCKLPQLRLPSTGLDKMFGPHLRAVYDEAVSPVLTWYGSCSWLTQENMEPWLTKLRRCMVNERADAHIILLLDVCPAHTAHRVLRHARQLGIRIVFIPASLTWLLQPLDTHVFVHFKRRIRRAVFDALSRDTSGRISHEALVRIHNRVIREVLVQGNFRPRLEAAGFCGNLATLRAPLAKMLAGMDLVGRAPTVPELAELMSVTPTRAAMLAGYLLADPLVPDLAAPAPDAPAGIPAAAVPPVYVPRVVRLLLPRGRLLRPGPRAPVVASAGRIVTRSMTAVSRSSASGL